MLAIYNYRVKNFKSVFLIDKILGLIKRFANKLLDEKLTIYIHTRDEDNRGLSNHEKIQIY